MATRLMKRDDAVALLYSCLLAGLVLGVHWGHRRKMAAVQRDTDLLRGKVAELSRSLQELRCILAAPSHRPHVVFHPLTDVISNERIRWVCQLQVESNLLAVSESAETIEVLRDGVYLVAVRCRYTLTPSELPRLIALLLNGVVLVQYAAPRHGCFGPTEVLSLRTGDAISVEYYGGVPSGDQLESGSIDMTLVLL